MRCSQCKFWSPNRDDRRTTEPEPWESHTCTITLPPAVPGVRGYAHKTLPEDGCDLGLPKGKT